ncbi:MAG: hypothetical protein R3D27_05925 [Hyphomicrobiaceae bacterium]
MQDTIAPTAAEIEEMRAIGAATLYEAQLALGIDGAMDPAIKPIHSGWRICGPAFTVDQPAKDNLGIHLAVTRISAGEVMVVDYKGEMDIAVIGDILALAARRRGCIAMVIDGAVRDAGELVGMDFPVFCRGLSIKGPGKGAKAALQAPITCGGRPVRPGDIIVGDADGLVIIDVGRWREVLAKGRERQAKEAATRAGLYAGKTTVEMAGLAPTLTKLGMI